MRNGASVLQSFKKEWKEYKFVIEEKAVVQQEVAVYALNEGQAWHLGLAKAMAEGHRALLERSSTTTRVEEIVKQIAS
jgi:hypothetical protein